MLTNLEAVFFPPEPEKSAAEESKEESKTIMDDRKL